MRNQRCACNVIDTKCILSPAVAIYIQKGCYSGKRRASLIVIYAGSVFVMVA